MDSGTAQREPERRRRKADPAREELEEFARGTDEAEPLLMPGPLPAQPALEPTQPPGPAERAAPAGPPPVHAEPAPPAKPQKRSRAGDPPSLARPVDPSPAPVLPSASPPPWTPQPAPRPSGKDVRRPRVPGQRADRWRRVGDVALLLLAAAVLAAAVFVLRR